MMGFIGEYEVAIDAKGRFLLPAGFRKQLPDGAVGNFVVNRGFENCLALYPVESWNTLQEKLSTMNDFNPKVREFKRLFLNGATMVELDSAGRLLLPKPLQEYAGIKKDMVFSAQGNKVELWDKEAYYEYLRKSAANFSDLAAEVAGGDFFNPF
ncbi:division/cell wall cluster transcriptional repressor MraZ [Taibaiella soli]|uniref:Transcriptional regulator MraZ n=1 Tax=Taibaiella soli TaxID=1649169 RepID=A0A2W2AAM3_9BACT|nr:division/cell wall cluster transcriptional repressor MraZ [Taibaiella soli]PZF72331.1 division/cell wall cluster transcriptional repressor MraZ [Taibaiella soli]